MGLKYKTINLSVHFFMKLALYQYENYSKTDKNNIIIQNYAYRLKYIICRFH